MAHIIGLTVVTELMDADGEDGIYGLTAHTQEIYDDSIVNYVGTWLIGVINRYESPRILTTVNHSANTVTYTVNLHGKTVGGLIVTGEGIRELAV
jgi:hypothetical protein